MHCDLIDKVGSHSEVAGVPALSPHHRTCRSHTGSDDVIECVTCSSEQKNSKQKKKKKYKASNLQLEGLEREG